jgi:hypothetical protein
MGRHLAVCAAVLGATPAFAQYAATSTPGVPYPTLTAATTVGLQAPAGVSPLDRGRAPLPLGFTFPYFNKTYSQVTVTANGVLFFEPSSAQNLTSDFFANLPLPNVAEPNATLAPFWDDLDGRNPTSALRSQSVTGTNGNGLAIEWSHWSMHFGSYDLNFQVRIWENGIVDFYYGSMSGSGASVSATVGIESPDGARGVNGKPCNSEVDAGVPAGAGCAIADFPGNELIEFGPPPGPDLSIFSLKIDGIMPSGPDLQISTTMSLRNFGTQPANNFTYRLYLSQDTVFQSGVDTELMPSPRGPLSIPALGSLVDSVTGTATRPDGGSFYVLAVVDDANVVAESNETNNTAVNGVPLANGVDLVAESISGPPLGGPGDMVTNQVKFSNQGLDPAGLVPVRILLSVDTTFDASDRVVYDGTLMVAGGQNVDQPITYPLAGTVPSGNYYFILVLDPDNTIPELYETNNVAVSLAPFTAMQADLTVTSIRVLQPVLPYNPASVAFFGEPIRLEATLKNQGGASAPNVTALFYLSDNETLNGITDPFIADLTGLSLGTGQSQTVTVDATVPTQNPDNSPLVAGPYFFFAAVVGAGLTETTTQNNFLKAPAMLVRTPAPDLTPTNVSGPAQIGSGERFVVARTLANIGNRPGNGVKYRYYLSANTIVTNEDVPLKIVTPGGLADDGTVSLDVGSVDVKSELVQVPSGLTSATYYLGVLMDPDGLVDEVTHDNDGLAGQQVTVVGEGLAVDTAELPDAVLNVPYSMQLSAAGGEGMYAWSLSPGASLPPGLMLSGDGVLSGTPSLQGAFALGLRVTSAGVSADGVRSLRVVPLTSSMAIATTHLPAPAQGVPYTASLAALGGIGPYSWDLAGGVLPEGVFVDPSGALTGTPGGALGTASTFTLRVRDAVGNSDERDFTLVVVDSAALLITTFQLPEALIGQQYAVDLVAASGAPADSGISPALPLTWAVASGELPPGLALSSPDATTGKVLLTGMPLVAGVFAFALEVVDAQGRSDRADYVLEVLEPSIRVKGSVPDRVARGDSVNVQFSVSGPVPPQITWTVRDGELPKGLALDSSGLLQGTVSLTAEDGHYAFTIAPVSAGQQLTFGSYAMEVVDKLDTGGHCGCAGEGGVLPLIALLLVVRRRRP